MNWIDTVNSAIQRYPTLYLKKSWEDSEFAVAHHFFIVLGNGCEWAKTKDPKKGGYLTEEKKYRKGEDWFRKIDPPYYKEPKINLHKDTFNMKVVKYQICEISHDFSEKSGYIEESRYSEGKRVKLSKRLYTKEELSDLQNSVGKIFIIDGYRADIKYNKKKHGDYILSAEPICQNWIISDRENPYPNFQKDYSPFWEDGVKFIQPDWRNAAIKHLKFWKTWFSDESNHKKYSYCPENTERGTLKDYIIKYCKGYSDPPTEQFIKKVRKEYGCSIFDGKNWGEMEQYRWRRHLKGVNSFLDNTLSLLESKAN